MCGCVDPVVAHAVGGRHAQLAAASARVNAAARGCGSAGGSAVRLCIFVTAEWSVHGFAGTEKRAVWRTLTPSRRRQRTTMKACLFTVTKCHKNAQSHRAPTCAPTPACCRVHSRARRLQLRVPPAHRKRHHRIYTSTHSNHHSNVQRQTPSKEKEFYQHHMVTCHILSHCHLCTPQP